MILTIFKFEIRLPINYGLLSLLILFLCNLQFGKGKYGHAISCFTCASRNRNDITCEDPFNASEHSYVEKCRVPKKGRDGLFPANFCIKVFGVRYNGTTRETLTVRRCALEDMYSQCGEFKLDQERFESGCILTCNSDGCNSSNSNFYLTSKFFNLLTFFTLLVGLLLISVFVS